MANTSTPSPRGIRPAQAAQKLGVSLSSLWRHTRENPNFPKPRKLGLKTTVWLEHELDSFLAQGNGGAQ